MANHEVLMLISADPPQRFQGIARLAGERGWHLRAERRHEPPRDWSGDGVLVMLEDIPPLADFVRKVRRRGIPVVDLLEDRPEVPLVRVAGDTPEIGRLAAAAYPTRSWSCAIDERFTLWCSQITLLSSTPRIATSSGTFSSSFLQAFKTCVAS